MVNKGPLLFQLVVSVPLILLSQARLLTVAHGPLRRCCKSAQLPTCCAPTQWEGNQGTRALTLAQNLRGQPKQVGGVRVLLIRSWGTGTWVGVEGGGACRIIPSGSPASLLGLVQPSVTAS